MQNFNQKRPSVTPEYAESIAIKALMWIGQDVELFGRFCSITGVEAHQIRAAASEPGFLAGLLRFIAADEKTVQRFADETETHIETILPSIAQLPGGDDNFEWSM